MSPFRTRHRLVSLISLCFTSSVRVVRPNHNILRRSSSLLFERADKNSPTRAAACCTHLRTEPAWASSADLQLLESNLKSASGQRHLQLPSESGLYRPVRQSLPWAYSRGLLIFLRYPRPTVVKHRSEKAAGEPLGLACLPGDGSARTGAPHHSHTSTMYQMCNNNS